VGGSANGTALATASSPTSPAAPPNPVLVLTVGHSVFRTLVETAEREGLDVNSWGLGLLMLGLGKQTAYLQSRRNRVIPDDSPDTPVRVVCINCARPRTDPGLARCSSCGGAWCTAFG
jgi:hypothetical protein